MRNDVRVRRLRKWAKYLRETVHPLVRRKRHKWDMSMWSTPKKGETNINPLKCTTAACAGGWASVIFKELSLESLTRFDSSVVGVLKFKEYGGEEAVEMFFGVSEDEVFHITHGERYKITATPLLVSSRIDSIANRYEKRGE